MSDSFPSCFRVTTSDHLQTSSSSSVTPNLTTCFYNTPLGLVALTWSQNIIGHSLNIQFNFDHSIPSFHLYLNPWLFWKKQGSKIFHVQNTNTQIEFYWDLTRAKFLSGPEPDSGFYIAVVVDGQMTILLGDSHDKAYAKTRAKMGLKNSVLVLRREHVFGNKCYTTKVRFGGENHDISIDCRSSGGDEPKLSFSVDRKRVLQVKRLRWKFRGNEKIEVDGVPIQVSWDVYNWLFDDAIDGHAVFMFRFDEKVLEEEKSDCDFQQKGLVLWQPVGLESEMKKMKKSLMKTSSSSSSSSASSSCSSSVMEWASMEESEMQKSAGFSLLVYAWKRAGFYTFSFLGFTPTHFV
ncbi:uncharacterized protein LOC143856243 isoform X1 [Tasmannia lanceolata]|uniref:uncharacterized protein LOC143856243 isoform X1 n=1 Tax=Tasmannia lanceolata TaxID=3420 RepID=UPI004062BBC3